MRTILVKIVRRIHSDPLLNVSAEWTSRALLLMLLSLLVAVTRGFIRSQFFHSHSGLVLIKRGVRLKNSHRLTIGKSFIAEEGCEIDALSKRGIICGNRVTVGAYALIRPSNAYGGAVGEGLRVGDNSNIGPFSYIGCSGYIDIGNNVMMGPRVSIYAENHIFKRTDLTMKEQGVSLEFVKIEDDCWIASHSVILPGVTVGRGSVVSAGSVVTKDVPPYSIVGGSPARIIKSRIEGQVT